MNIVIAAVGLLVAVAFSRPPGATEIEPNTYGAALSRIAFGSCADQNKPQPIWDAALGADPDLFIFMGDNVYGKVSTPELTELKDAYATLRSVPGFRMLRERTPILAIWDDYDYGRNDGGGDFDYRYATKDLFLDFWNIPRDDARRRHDGLYHAATFGPTGRRVQVILLDTRFFRSPLKKSDAPGSAGKEKYVPDDDPAKTMLGGEQWRWLEQQLRKRADLRLIVSSIQVIAEGHGYERWGNLPGERRRLFELISRTGARGVIFLSGDRHFGALYKWGHESPYPFYEVTSSSLNRPYSPKAEAGPNRLGEWYGHENFGMVVIDWDTEEILLELRDIEGKTVRQVAISFAEIGNL